MIDYAIVGVSSVSFFSFVIGLILSVRAKGQAEILVSMKKIFIGLAATGCGVLWMFLGGSSDVEKVVVLFIYIFLFWAMSFSYILGLFGIPLTSVRIQFLLTLVSHGDRGAHVKTLMKEYSKDSLIRIRLHRLMSSGEIIRKGNYYVLRSRWSYFILHNMLLLFLIALYRPIGREKPSRTHPTEESESW